MARREDDCDWSHDPWFLRGEDDHFVAMGFPLAARRDAAANLARLYTPTVCRAIREDPVSGYGMVIFLFHCYWPGLLVPLLEVGRDLGVVAPWDDTGLLTRLTKRNEFYEAAFELRVLASLRRRGYRSERVPEDPPRKTPDLRVQIGTEWHDVEIKAVHPSPIDDAAETLHERLMMRNLLVPGLRLTLLGGEELRRRATHELAGVLKEADAIADAFAETASDIRATRKPGDYPVPGYGLIHAVPGPRFGSVTPMVMPDLSQRRRIVKAMRLARRATEQLKTRRGITLIGVWHSANLLRLAERIRAEARERPTEFRTTHMVVLVDSVTDEKREYGYGSIPVALPVQVHERRQLTKAQLRFAKAAAGDGGRDSTFVRAAKPGERGVALRTTRLPHTAVSLGSASLPVGGGTVQFYFDGRPPEVSPLDDDSSGADP
jgi:hypothetical protein